MGSRQTGPRGGLARAIAASYAGAWLVLAVTAANAGGGWDATWHGGFDNGGDGVQVVIAGGHVIGFYYHGDYLDTDDGVEEAGGSIRFHWSGGEGVLSNSGGKRQLAIHEPGRADRVIPLSEDQ
jgi:hypothetical protein